MEKQTQDTNKAKEPAGENKNDQQDSKPVVMKEGKKYHL